MKKTTRMIGACALSMSLVLGCAAPAFAVGDPNAAKTDTYGTDVDNTLEADRLLDRQEGTEDAKVDTDVHVATMITNINVAVPLNVTLVADSKGGDIMKPSAGVKVANDDGTFNPEGIKGYRIENYSSYPVKIDAVKTTEDDEGFWRLVNDLDTTTFISATDSKVGDLDLELAPSDANAAIMSKNEGNIAADKAAEIVDLAAAKAAEQNPGWIIDSAKSVYDTGDNAGKGLEPSIMGLLLYGQSSRLKSVNHASKLLRDSGDPDAATTTDWRVGEDVATETGGRYMPDKAFKITYTVSAASRVDTVAGYTQP